jgi:malate dehydrogenase (oxaloacetate-decarboxylating)
MRSLVSFSCSAKTFRQRFFRVSRYFMAAASQTAGAATSQEQLSHLGEIPLDGIDLLRNRFFNKGTAFNKDERRLLHLDGVLPSHVETIDDQLVRLWKQFTLLAEPINRYQLLRTIQATNNTLYYAFIERHMTDVLPIIYTPTVGEACLKFGTMYQREHGLYFPTSEIGNFRTILDNSRRKEIDLIVITDGSRILGLGDLGTNGMGISIGKCSLYVAGAGIHPRKVLPIVYDSGTDNVGLRTDPMYLGQRIPKVADDVFYQGLDEFMEAVKNKWPNATVQFEDWSNNHCFDMLARYRHKYRCFNDDIQGTGAVISAGFFNAIKLSKVDAHHQKIVVFGAGSAAVGVVSAIADLIAARSGLDKAEVLGNVYLVDTKGLVTTTRGDKLQEHKIPFARKDAPHEISDLFEVIKYVKPTALIGLAAAGPVFTKEMVEYMCTYNERPIIFPLSNPTSKSEIDPANAYAWSKGKAIVASGSPYPVTNIAGRTLRPSQGNNMYIFPGVGLGCSVARPTTISDLALVKAASALVDLVSEKMLYEDEILYPPLTSIREVSKHVASAVVMQAQAEGVATVSIPNDKESVMNAVSRAMWEPQYLDFTEVHPLASAIRGN